MNAWAINFGWSVGDILPMLRRMQLLGFISGSGSYPGDKVLTVDWSIGGVGSGTSNVLDTFLFVNQFGYEIHQLRRCILRTADVFSERRYESGIMLHNYSEHRNIATRCPGAYLWRSHAFRVLATKHWNEEQNPTLQLSR